MSYTHYILQNHEYLDQLYHNQHFPTIWPNSRQNTISPMQQKKPLIDLMDHDLIFSPDGTMVMTESQTIPLVYYTHRLRESYTHHYMNDKTATCSFWIKAYSDYVFPAHRAYFATQSIYFRTIFERLNLNGSQCVELDIPFPDVFPGIYKYFYDGDAEAWLKYWFKDTEQVRRTWKLVEYLELVQIPEKVSLRARMELDAVRLTRC